MVLQNLELLRLPLEVYRNILVNNPDFAKVVGLVEPVAVDIHAGQPLAAVQVSIDAGSMSNVFRPTIILGGMGTDYLLARFVRFCRWMKPGPVQYMRRLFRHCQ